MIHNALTKGDERTVKLKTTVELFSNMPTLETERLILRKMRPSDSSDMFEYACRDDVTRYLVWKPHADEEYTRQYLTYIESRYKSGSFYDWAVVLKDSGKMIGTCGFTRFDCDSDCAEIGYVINPQYRGIGIAAEAARTVICFGFERLSLHRIEAKFMYGNQASLRVMQKLGMRFEGYHRDAMLVKGVYRTIGISSILRGEYEALY